MINNIKYIIVLIVTTFFFSCSGRSGNSSDADTTASPGPVSEMDRSRYNLNEPDEMMHEMQDSVGMGTDTSRVSADKNKIDSLID